MNAVLSESQNSATASATEKTILIGKTPEELKELVVRWGEPAFRAKQLHHWLYVKGVRDFDQMTDLAKSFRAKLKGEYHCQAGILELADKQVSQDGTVKYLFRLPDGKLVESVLMYFEDRDNYSVCVSSQVGCAVDCKFCATGKLGFKRNLTVEEITDQYMFVQSDSGKEVRNIVFMGQGEPLLNYDNVLKALKILNKSAEVGIRHITVSTSGIVPAIDKLAKENLQLVLAVSLHAPDNDTRSQFMPINNKWPVEDLIAALHRYVDQQGRRITIEYVMLDGINCTEEHAHKLGKLLKNLKCNINLIPYNPIGDIGTEFGFKRPSPETIRAFYHTLTPYGKKVTTRLERGVDIDAACGQLANKNQA